jgi:superfamily II DNA or RNA helicase
VTQTLPKVYNRSTSAEKIALFRILFAGRLDVYAKPDNRPGQRGWYPAEVDWRDRRGGAGREFLPLTDAVVERHLRGNPDTRDDLHVGLYVMLPDDTCQLLAVDFDKTTWREDAWAYAQACAEAGVPAAAEVSRSGNGAHVWTFFTAPVMGATARALGFAMLRAAMASTGRVRLASYDRLFPAQDVLPSRAKGTHRFGNLIALPLQGTRRHGRKTTVFCEPSTWDIYPDQFAFLSGLHRLTPDEVEAIASRLAPVHVGTSTPERPRRPRRATVTGPPVVRARLDSMLSVDTTGLPGDLVSTLKHAASLHNPEFYRRQQQRYPVFGIPRFIQCFDVDGPWLRLPRGLLDKAVRILATASSRLEVTDDLPVPTPTGVKFTAELFPAQADAVEALAPHTTGVLVGTTGVGKTVMACALIARHQVPTAIIVNNAELLAQWQERLRLFLDLGDTKVGVLGGGKDTRGGVVDLIMLQTISHRDAPAGSLDGYGMVVVDECHSVGAPAASAAMKEVRARRWLGLTATPFRADGMDDLITMHCGPVRHEIVTQPEFTQRLVTHPTPFTTAESAADGASMQAIYSELATDEARNQQICADVADAVARGRNSLVLTTRLAHVDALSDNLRRLGIRVLVRHGRQPRDDRAATRAALRADASTPLVLVAIDKVVGEGFDLPHLDTLFLTMPVSWKGLVMQQVGRILRPGPGKSTVEVHDYVDHEVPWLRRMHANRDRTLAKLGFAPPPPNVPLFTNQR